ncbi:MAG: WecB/TagA/CpsF family glycosyltransferase [Myxococcota bacterium]
MTVRGELLGVPLHGLELVGLQGWFEEALQGHVPRRVYVLTAGALLEAERNVRLRQLLREGDLSLVGEEGVARALRWSGGPRLPVLSPREFLPPVLRWLGSRGGKVFYVGGAPGVAERWAERMRGAFPGLSLVTQDGFGEKWGPENDRILRRIKGEAPQLLLVGMGSPYQDEYVHAHASLVRVPVCVAVGKVAEEGMEEGEEVGVRSLRAGGVGERLARWGVGWGEKTREVEGALLLARALGAVARARG